MEAVFPPDFIRTGTGDVPQIPSTGNKRNLAVSARIITETSSYPTGNDWKQQRKSPGIIGNHSVSQTQKSNTSIMTSSEFFLSYPELDLPELRFLLFTITTVFRFDGPSDFTTTFDGISYQISTEFRIGFHSGFQPDSNGICTRIAPIFR
jgi:hypothetical protein